MPFLGRQHSRPGELEFATNLPPLAAGPLRGMTRNVPGYTCCLLLAIGILTGSFHVPASLSPTHHGATIDQVEHALGWSLLSGLATGVGGAVVFCLEPPTRHGHGAGVSAQLLAFMMGLAVGVMVVLSLLDMIIPKLWKYGITVGATAAIIISFGVATIYGLDLFITYFDKQVDGFGGGMGESGPVLPLASPKDRKGQAEAAAAQTARAKSAC